MILKMSRLVPFGANLIQFDYIVTTYIPAGTSQASQCSSDSRHLQIAGRSTDDQTSGLIGNLLIDLFILFCSLVYVDNEKQTSTTTQF